MKASNSKPNNFFFIQWIFLKQMFWVKPHKNQIHFCDLRKKNHDFSWFEARILLINFQKFRNLGRTLKYAVCCNFSNSTFILSLFVRILEYILLLMMSTREGLKTFRRKNAHETIKFGNIYKTTIKIFMKTHLYTSTYNIE